MSIPTGTAKDRDDLALRSGRINPRTVEDFEDSYATTPAWDIGRPQVAFQSLADTGVLRGKLLDVGCGTGEHALLAASLGYDATGVDLAQLAIATARAKAQMRGLAARFFVCSALDLATLSETFDTVLDSGLFHVLSDADRIAFAASLRAAMRIGGKFYLLCFSERQPGQWGPRRISEDEIRSVFDAGWQVVSIEPTKFELRTAPQGAHAWLACIAAT
jgi:SAM-dependent methyltransferase